MVHSRSSQGSLPGTFTYNATRTRSMGSPVFANPSTYIPSSSTTATGNSNSLTGQGGNTPSPPVGSNQFNSNRYR